MTETVEFTERQDGSGRGALVQCTLTLEDGRKFLGAARVMTMGLDRAKERAEAQARDKARGAAE